MRTVLPALLLLASLAACGGSSPKPVGGSDPELDPVEPPRSELQVRQEAACEAVGRKNTQCAIEDTAAQSPDVRKEADPERTAAINTREFIKGCTAQYMSSRQVRVYEVCLKEETECEPFLTCLDNALPKK